MSKLNCATPMKPTEPNPDPNSAAFIQVFRQNWENARHIKNERLTFTNIYAIVAAGVLSLIHGMRDEPVLEISLLVFLCTFSGIGLLTMLRLRAELEECLHSIERMVKQAGMESFMPLVDARGARTRLPKFRWLFPLFFAIATCGFLFLLIYRLWAHV